MRLLLATLGWRHSNSEITQTYIYSNIRYAPLPPSAEAQLQRTLTCIVHAG